MPIVGNITRAKASISFLCARTEAGSPLDAPLQTAEELTTPGVDGRRWRTMYRQFTPFTLTTVTECTNFLDAIYQRRSIESMTNKIVSLSVNVSGNNLSFPLTYVQAVKAVCVPGPVVAVGSTGGTAHLIAEWSLVMTSFPTEAL